MPDLETIQNAVEHYLAQHMAGLLIDLVERSSYEEGTRFVLHSNEGNFELIVLDEALTMAVTEKEIIEILEQDNVVEVMRDLIEFPVKVTSNGCIF